MDAAKYAALFAAESREHIQHCNAHLLAWERAPAAPEPIQGLFRSVHTLKGMAATMGFARVAGLAHALEHLLAAVRDGSVTGSPRLADLMFEAVDQLERGCELAQSGADDGLEIATLSERLVEAARSGSPRASPPLPPPGGAPAPVSGQWLTVRIRLSSGIAMPGARAAVLLRRAQGFGPVESVTPPLERWMDERFDGTFGFRLMTEAPPDEIRTVLVGVGGEDVRDVLVGDTPPGPAPRDVRVDPARLDNLLALTGELVVARNRLAAVTERRRDSELEEIVDQVGRLVSEVQDQVQRTRMAPVNEVLERFPRAVRDLARDLEKRVRFEIAGGEIELDRAILDALADPLMHLVRNAVDHGIESPAERADGGKDPEGMVRVRARRERNQVAIEIEDDGRGVNIGAVRERARREGWVNADEPLEDGALLGILSRPGFSTAAHRVSGVSGRGVGIDAVSHWVHRLGGTMDLRSRTGAGMTVTLRLPLTMAILPALLVEVHDRRYAVPLGFVAETTRVRSRAGGKGVTDRGESLALIDLGEGVVEPRPGGGDRRAAVILEVGGRRGALAVDTLLGQADIVIGQLTAPVGMPRWVNGATILADGRPALVLDAGALVAP